ncbi:cellulase family glycosylhydrolase [Desulfoglaeba alkanexedens]|uniref:Uncharacterized protein n=1 Tax=Desulfoglaeba alkanexedens ALDC TaxID=980445 RepID=A0A4P8KZX4_9BACT|nr:cellulase family glycosylhydrolase [Desulfoglaeba alkanexedens]QCQ20833.1 hypothetical protein FDQ92_00625 [Desulfoglaeba alkanexedens ALDC]
MRKAFYFGRTRIGRATNWVGFAIMASACLWIAAVAAGEHTFVLGVGTHLQSGKRDLEKSLDRLAAAGVMALRDDVPWSLVEQTPGKLHIPDRWDRLVNEANARGINPLLILDYGNKFYDDGDKPTSDEAIAAFTRYAAFVAAHFKGRVPYYEIWNEWGWSGGSPEDYVRLVKSVYPAVKGADPDAIVLVGADVPVGAGKSHNTILGGFIEQIILQGVLNFVDALSLHTYVHCEPGSHPEDWAAWMRQVEEELKRTAGGPVPFYITEMGWPTCIGSCGIDIEEQARYLARMFLLARTMPFIKGIWWYDLQNDGPDPKNREHNFGLLNHDLTPKPAYTALKSVSPVVREGRYVGSLYAGPAVHILRFDQGETTALAFWKEEHAPCSAVWLTSSKPIQAKVGDIDGCMKPVSWEAVGASGYRLPLPLSEMPQMLFLAGEAISLDKLGASCAREP